MLLSRHELRINTLGSDKLGVRTRLDDFSMVENENAMGIDHTGKPVRDNQCGPPFHEPVQSLLYEHLVLGINAGERLVEHENRGVIEKGAGDGETLPFAAGEACRPVLGQAAFS